MIQVDVTLNVINTESYEFWTFTGTGVESDIRGVYIAEERIGRSDCYQSAERVHTDQHEVPSEHQGASTLCLRVVSLSAYKGKQHIG